MRGIHLQRQEIQRAEGGRRERRLPRHSHLPFLYQVHQVSAGDLLQDRPEEHGLRDRSGRDAQFHGSEAGRGTGPQGGGRTEGRGGEQPYEAAGEPDGTVEERDRTARVAGGAQRPKQEAAGGGLRFDAERFRYQSHAEGD